MHEGNAVVNIDAHGQKTEAHISTCRSRGRPSAHTIPSRVVARECVVPSTSTASNHGELQSDVELGRLVYVDT